METKPAKPPLEIDIGRLENQLDKLLKTCDGLKNENTLLRERQLSLVAERARLMEKNEIARARVESMILRLKSLEDET